MDQSISYCSGMQPSASGYLYLIIGPMFAGKSSKLIRLIQQFRLEQVSLLVIKHSFDNRYNGVNYICSHDPSNGQEPCQHTNTLLNYNTRQDYNDAQIIIIEEAQFFGNDLIDFCSHAIDIDNKYVIVSGLSGTYKRETFGCILNLIPLADKIDKLESYCDFCLETDSKIPASFTLKYQTNNLVSSDIEVGDSELYKPVCRKHYNQHNKYC